MYCNCDNKLNIPPTSCIEGQFEEIDQRVILFGSQFLFFYDYFATEIVRRIIMVGIIYYDRVYTLDTLCI